VDPKNYNYFKRFSFLSSFFLGGGAQRPQGPGPPHSRGFYFTHNDTPQSLGLLWASD